MNKSWPLNWNEMEINFICFKVVAKTSYISKIFCCTWVSCPFMLSSLPEGTVGCFSRWDQIETYVYLILKKVGLVRTKPPESFLFRTIYESKVKANNAKMKKRQNLQKLFKFIKFSNIWQRYWFLTTKFNGFWQNWFNRSLSRNSRILKYNFILKLTHKDFSFKFLLQILSCMIIIQLNYIK